MHDYGITAIVNLREANFSDEALGVAGERHLHLPTIDNTPPTIADLPAWRRLRPSRNRPRWQSLYPLRRRRRTRPHPDSRLPDRDRLVSQHRLEPHQSRPAPSST